MKDLKGFTHSFPHWEAVLDFLAGAMQKKENITELHIIREREKEWILKVGVSNPVVRGAGLYDLYW